MQQIERYGLIAILSLIIGFGSVLTWNEKEPAQFLERPVARPIAQSRTEAPPVNSRLPEAVPRPERSGARAIESAPVVTAERSQEDERMAEALARPSRQVPAPETEPVKAAEVQTVALRDGAQSLAQSADAPRQEPKILRAVEPSEQPDSVERAAGVSDVTYTVAPGDNLGHISLVTLGTSKRFKEIQDLNGLSNPNKIVVGQKLLLPVGARRPGQLRRPTTPGKRTYRIQAGDVLSVIAQRELGRSALWKQIVELNPGLDPNRLAVGKEITLPAGGDEAFLVRASGSSTHGSGR